MSGPVGVAARHHLTQAAEMHTWAMPFTPTHLSSRCGKERHNPSRRCSPHGSTARRSAVAGQQQLSIAKLLRSNVDWGAAAAATAAGAVIGVNTCVVGPNSSSYCHNSSYLHNSSSSNSRDNLTITWGPHKPWRGAPCASWGWVPWAQSCCSAPQLRSVQSRCFCAK
jgi:hypothetical protein